MYALVYNLVRLAMWEASRRQGVNVARISFIDAMRWLAIAGVSQAALQLLVNPEGPNRFEPRVRKRRPKEYPVMKKPRDELRKALLHQRHAA